MITTETLVTYFQSCLDEAMMKKFQIKTKTYFNLPAETYITTREDGLAFTPDQHKYISGYTDGYDMVLALINRSM